MSPTPTDASNHRSPWFGLAFVLLLAYGGNEVWQWWRETRITQDIQAHVQPGSLTLYTTSTCPYCAQARHWLKGRHIVWRECNVETNATCRQAFERQGSPGVPLVEANGRWQLGFDPVWIAHALQAPPLPASPTQSSPNTDSSPRP